MNKSNREKIDRLGIVTSGLCALHCAALPIMMSLGLVGGVSGMLHDRVELMVIIISSCLGLLSIYNGLNGHGLVIPQVIIGFGALLIVISLVIPILGHGSMAIGGSMLLYGHWLNWRQLSIKD